MSKSSGNQPLDHEANLAYSKAAKAELARDYDQAFRLYVKSAELYIHLGRSAPGSSSNAKANANKALQRAEKIKAFIDKHKPSVGTYPADGQSPITLTPIGIDYFSTQEQSYVLKKGAFVNGLTYSKWDDLSASDNKPQASGLPPYEDPDGQPKLSPEQAKVHPVWLRPPIARHAETRQVLPQEILQHIVTDCSVCASISVCLEHSRRFGSNLAQAALSRQSMTGTSQKNDTRSLEGRYDLRILFNGAWRRVIIDNCLPYHPIDGTLMCMSVLPRKDDSTALQPVLWPSFLEKGYIKLMGGYDFPGSNSSTDLHAIAGWIPEHIEIKRSGFEREKTWQRILDGFTQGLCVFTLGTGTSPRVTWGDVRLLSSHSYAVIDVMESNDERLVSVLDSWVNSNHKKEDKQQACVLRIPWLDVLNIFDGIYLSWDPSRWPNTLTYHGMWRRGVEDEESSTRQVYLRFAKTKSGVEEDLWILLTRHVTDSCRTSDFISLKVEVEDEWHSKSSVADQTTVTAKGTYTNSTHFLVRAKVPASQTSGVLSIFTSYDGDGMEIGFTLSIYALNFEIVWDETVPAPPFTKKIEGVLTNKNAGGNCTYPTFMLNPQYHLRIHSANRPAGGTKANVALTTLTSRDTPVNITLAYSQGGRIDELTQSELMANSGAYTYGLARLRKEISPGDYTVILSAFEPHHMGPFSLKVDSSQPFDLSPIPQEDAGMYMKVVRGAWTSKSSGGGPTSGQYSKNPIYEICIQSFCRIKIRLQLLRPSTPTLLNVTVFTSSPSDVSIGRHVATSGAYCDAISGVITPQVGLAPGKYWIVPSTYNPGVQASFQLFVYSSLAGIQVTEL